MEEINKVKTNPVKSQGESIYTDISYTETTSGSGSRYWILSVDEFTSYSWSVFSKKKSEIPEKLIKIIQKILNDGKQIKYIRLDNSGENKILQEDCEREHLKIKFEYTSRDTPMKNGIVERKFQKLYNRLRATLKSSGLTSYLKKYFWAECALCVTKLENICVAKHNEKSPYERFHNSKSKISNELRKFGEIGVVNSQATSLERSWNLEVNQ